MSVPPFDLTEPQVFILRYREEPQSGRVHVDVDDVNGQTRFRCGAIAQAAEQIEQRLRVRRGADDDQISGAQRPS